LIDEQPPLPRERRLLFSLLTLPSLDIELEKGVEMDDIWPEGKKRGELEGRIFELANGVPLRDSTKS